MGIMGLSRSKGGRERVWFSCSLLTKGLCRDGRRLRVPLAFETDRKGTPVSHQPQITCPGLTCTLWAPVPHMIRLNSLLGLRS